MVRRGPLQATERGQNVAKDKKKRNKGGSPGGKAAKRLKALTDNRIVADVIAAALVATASALKDSKKARQLAASAGDELEKLSKKGAEQGNAMWQLALDIGRRSLEELADSGRSGGKSRRR
jgi:general stress protein YciG